MHSLRWRDGETDAELDELTVRDGDGGMSVIDGKKNKMNDGCLFSVLFCGHGLINKLLHFK